LLDRPYYTTGANECPLIFRSENKIYPPTSPTTKSSSHYIDVRESLVHYAKTGVFLIHISAHEIETIRHLSVERVVKWVYRRDVDKNN